MLTEKLSRELRCSCSGCWSPVAGGGGEDRAAGARARRSRVELDRAAINHSISRGRECWRPADRGVIALPVVARPVPFGEDRSRVGKAAADLVDHGTLAFDGPVLRVQGDVSAKLDHDLVESEKGVAHVLGKSAEWVGHRGVNVPAPVGGGAARSTRFGCDALPALRRTCVALTGRWAARRRPGPVAAVPRWREVLPLPLATPRARIESPPCWLAVREAVPSAR